MTGVAGAIVAGVDGSAGSGSAVRWAAAEAVRHHVPLHVVHGFSPFDGLYGPGAPMVREVYADLLVAAEDMLAEAVRAARHAGGGSLRVTSDIVDDLPAPMLVDASATARMVVLGASGAGGFPGMLTGSTAVRVAAHAHCPVVVVRGRDGSARVPEEGPVVAGVDGSPTSERALAVAVDEASRRRATLVAVHVWSDDAYAGALPPALDWDEIAADEERLLAQRLAGWQEKYPDVRVERVVVRDRPRDRLLTWSGRAALVVVGSRGRGGFRGLLLGSTSQALIHHSHCPVVVVRPGAAKSTSE